MKQPLLIGFALTVMLTVLPAPAATAQETERGKPRIAVLEFANKSGARSQRGGAQSVQDVFVTEIQDVFVTELRQSGLIYDVSKEQMCEAVRRTDNLTSGGDCEALLREHNLTLSGDIDPATAVRVGKLLGVNHLLTGSVTEYGVTDRRARRGGRKFVAALSTRLIDTSTGEIAWADEARREVSVGGFGGGVDDARMFDTAMKPCIRQLTDSLKAANLASPARKGGRPRRQKN
jgi:curli biogenesis system outer membrane secretion channel CsgG